MNYTILVAFVTAFLAFIAVNIDELAALVFFFAQVDGSEMTNSDVVIGQLLGFSIVFGISLLGILLNTFIDLQYVALIGFLPLMIGTFQLYKVLQFWYSVWLQNRDEKELLLPVLLTDGDDSIVQSQSAGLEDHLLAVNNRVNSSDSNSSSDSSSGGYIGGMFRKYTSGFLRPSIVTVTITIFADGSEEIGVFFPLFATASTVDLVVTIVTFYALVLLQCFLAYQLVQCKHIGKFLSRYSKNVMPFLLIGIGLYVLSDSILAHMIVDNNK